MTMPLTERQEQLWNYIRSCERSPSFVEMQKALGLDSKSGVSRLIKGLQERGYVRRFPNRARSIVAVEPASAREIIYLPFRGRIS